MTGVVIETDIFLRSTAFGFAPSVDVSWYGQSRATDLSINFVTFQESGDVSLSAFSFLIAEVRSGRSPIQPFRDEE